MAKRFLRCLLLVVACQFAAAHARASDPSLQLSLTSTAPPSPTTGAISIALTVYNTTKYPVSIYREVSVEKSGEFRWIPATAIQAVADCTHYNRSRKNHDPVVIPPGETLTTVAFNGANCGNQCHEECSDNPRLRAGIYHFVVLTNTGEWVASAPFSIP